METQKQRWSEREVKLLEELRKKNFSIPYISQKLGRSEKSIFSKSIRSGLNEKYPVSKGRPLKSILNKHLSTYITKTDFVYECELFTRYNQHLKIFEKSALIMGDCHIPYINLDMYNKMKLVVKNRKPKCLILSGDITNQDAFSLYISEGGRGSFRKERYITDMFFEDMLELFDKIYIIMGNHDMRFFKVLMGEIEAPQFFKIFTDQLNKNIFVSGNYRYCEFNKTWRITHPKNYSKISTRVAESIAVIHQNKNIATGHGHHQGFRFEPSGKWMCVDVGCMCDANKLEYTAVVDSTNPKWNYGFMIIEDEFPEFFNRYMTNWSKYK